MMRFSRWTILAMAVVLASTSSADAFGRRRGCNGNGGGCHGGYSGCHGGYSGCHGGHGGRVYSGGCHGGGYVSCHGGGMVHTDGRPVYYGRTYSGVQRDSFYSSSEPVPLPARSTTADVNYGTIDFRAPTGAEVWVDGQLVQRRGDAWRWTSPALTSGRRNFEVRGRWMVDGRPVTRTRSVSVDANGRTTIDFTRPEGSEILPASTTIDRPLDTAPGATPPRSTTTPNTPPAPAPATQPRPTTNPPPAPRPNTIPPPAPRPNNPVQQQ